MTTENDTGSTSFDLRALVREVAAESDAADPAIVAKEVERRLDPALFGEALAQALPTVVYHLSRQQAPTLTPPRGQITSDSQGLLAAGRGGPSRKVAAIRQTWRRHLRDRVSVGEQEWKFLGDCTVNDLAYAAAVRDDLARANAARADWLRDLAALVTDAGVERVDQLADAVLAERLGGAA